MGERGRNKWTHLPPSLCLSLSLSSAFLPPLSIPRISPLSERMEKANNALMQKLATEVALLQWSVRKEKVDCTLKQFKLETR